MKYFPQKCGSKVRPGQAFYTVTEGALDVSLGCLYYCYDSLVLSTQLISKKPFYTQPRWPGINFTNKPELGLKVA